MLWAALSLGSGLARSRDGVPIWAGDQATFEEYIEACLMYEQTIVREKRYLCGPRCASELRGAARRILVGKPADWLSHEGGVRMLITALREERGYPKIPEMSELLMRYFKGTRRQRGETMQDFVMRKAEAYTRAQQSMVRLQQEGRRGPRPVPTTRRRSGTSSRGEVESEELQEEQPEEASEESMLTPREQEEGQDEEEWDDGWAWSRSQGWFRTRPTAPSHRSRDTSELGRNALPEILPDYIQGWFLFVDSGLDTMERNVLQAELRGNFSVRAVEQVLRKHWTDYDIKKRDSERGRQFGNMADDPDDDVTAMMNEWDLDVLQAEGFTGDDLAFLSDEREKVFQAYETLQQGRRTLREARSKQHAVKMSRQFYPVRAQPGQSSSWRPPRRSDESIKCFRCGGPHKVADCKEKPPVKPGSQGHIVDEATFVFLAESNHALLGDTVKSEDKCLTTREVMEQGKAIVDGGATRTIGSVEALARVVDLNEQMRGTTGIRAVDMSDRPVFGFGNSSRDRCSSTASIEVPLDGRLSTLKVHALDKGSAPVLMSIHSLRRLGAIIDFEANLAIFRAVDPKKVIELECTSAGHQVMPLTDDAMKCARLLSQPMPSFKDLE